MYVRLCKIYMYACGCVSLCIFMCIFIFYAWYVYVIMFASSVCMSVISHLSALLVFVVVFLKNYNCLSLFGLLEQNTIDQMT